MSDYVSLVQTVVLGQVAAACLITFCRIHNDIYIKFLDKLRWDRTHFGRSHQMNFCAQKNHKKLCQIANAFRQRFAFRLARVAQIIENGATTTWHKRISKKRSLWSSVSLRPNEINYKNNARARTFQFSICFRHSTKPTHKTATRMNWKTTMHIHLIAVSLNGVWLMAFPIKIFIASFDCISQTAIRTNERTNKEQSSVSFNSIL